MDRMDELDDMIKHGWGSVPGDKIPKNYREIPGPGLGKPDEIEDDSTEESELIVTVRSARRSASKSYWEGLIAEAVREKNGH